MRGLALVLLTSALAATACAGSSAAPTPAPTTSPSPTSVTSPVLLLMQVLDVDGYAVDNALIGVTGPGGQASPASASIAYVPASLLVPLAPVAEGATAPPEITLGATAQQSDTLTPWQSTIAAFDLDVTGSWTLDRLAFAGLIDAVDGVVVEVPRTITVGEADSGQSVVLSPGRQRLGGIVGAEYATVHVPGESERDALGRFRDVLTSVLARLPEDPERLRQILTSLGSLARTTTDVDTILAMLAGSHEAILGERMREAYVAVDVIRSGARPASTLSEEGSRTVASMFADFEVSATPSGGAS